MDSADLAGKILLPIFSFIFFNIVSSSPAGIEFAQGILCNYTSQIIPNTPCFFIYSYCRRNLPHFQENIPKSQFDACAAYHNRFAFLYTFTDDFGLLIIRFNKVSYNNIFCFAACKHTANRNGKTPTSTSCGEVIGSLLLLSIRVVIAHDTTIN